MIYIISFVCLIIRNTFGLDQWIEHFDYNTYIDDDERYEVYWTSHQSSCILEIGLAVKTDGWVGFGITESGSMANADIVVGWVTDDDDEYIIQNRIGPLNGNGYPSQFDDQSGIKSIDGWKEDINGIIMTYLHFEKEMFPHFDERALSVKIGTTQVIYAWRDGVLTADSDISNHGFGCQADGTRCRGHEAMNLAQGESTEVPLPEGAQSHDIYMADVLVPDDDTTYYCSLLELPHYDNVQHVVQIDPIIQPENVGIVHHILAYSCPEHLVNVSHVGEGTVCDDLLENMPGVWCAGGDVFFGWAVGGKSFYFPENVGIEMSGDVEDSIQYVLLETHYDNPERRNDIVDSSGLRIWYTDQLRADSAKVINVGTHSNQRAIFIPPGIQKAAIYGFCFPECLGDGINNEPIYAFANTLHSHLLGVQLYLRHIRDGKELRPLDMNEAYDFNYQQMASFQEMIEILPGDTLILECIYDSTDKEVTTYGGRSTNDEMCLSFLLVYPKPNVVICTSRFLGYFDGNEWDEDLGRFYQEAAANRYYNASSDFYDVTVEGALGFYNQFQNGTIFSDDNNGAKRVQTCIDSNGEPLPGNEGIYSALRKDIDYDSFNDDDYYICEDESDSSSFFSTAIHESDERDEDSSSGFEWDSWYVYLVAVLIGILLIALIVYVIYKLKIKNTNENTSYQRVLGKQEQESKPTDYGTSTAPKKPQIAMGNRL